jgi:glycosyltransferase involved in cell wall biosynthesis
MIDDPGDSGAPDKTVGRRLHILEVIGNAIVGGMESTVYNLIKALPADQFEVTCICPFESPFTARLRQLGCKVFVTQIRDDPPWSSIELVATIIQHQAIDLVHAHLLNAHTLAAISARMANIPVLATIHSMTLWAQEISVARTTGSHLVTVCQQAFAQALATGVHPQNVSIIPNGVDVERFCPSEANSPLREMFNLASHIPIVGFVGRLSPEKGPDKFVLTADRVCQNHPDVHFVLVGDGPEREMLEGMISRSCAPDRIHLAGSWQNTEHIYPSFEILLQTSRSEAMPLAIIEAMACGIPVIALAVGGVAEIIEAGSTGIHISPFEPPGVLSRYSGDWPGVAQATLELLSLPGRRRQMGIAARQRAIELFNVEQNTIATATLFRQLIAERERPLHVRAVADPKTAKPAGRDRLQRVG